MHCWIGKCGEMESAATLGNRRKLYQLIRNSGPWGPSVSDVIRKPTSQCSLLGASAGALGSLVKPITVALPRLSENEPMHVDTTPLSKMEITMGIGFLKRHKAGAHVVMLHRFVDKLIQKGKLFPATARLFAYYVRITLTLHLQDYFTTRSI